MHIKFLIFTWQPKGGGGFKPPNPPPPRRSATAVRDYFLDVGVLLVPYGDLVPCEGEIN